MSELICKTCDKPITGQYSSFVGWSSEDCQPVGVYYHNECVPPLVISEPKTIILDIANGYNRVCTCGERDRLGEIAQKEFDEKYGVWRQIKPITEADVYRFKDEWNFSPNAFNRVPEWAQFWADKINEFFGVKESK